MAVGQDDDGNTDRAGRGHRGGAEQGRHDSGQYATIREDRNGSPHSAPVEAWDCFQQQ
jgi:hypothetical protein